MIASSARRPTSIDELLSPELSARLDRLDLHSRKVFAGKMQGERRSKRRGQSVEFADHRNYVPGDDLRRIDWNVFARMDRFFVKIFQEEEDLALHILLDASPSMDAGSPSKLIFALRVATALGYIGLVNNNRVAVSVFDNTRLLRLPPTRGRRNLQRLARFLIDAVNPAAATGAASDPSTGVPMADFTGALRAVAQSRAGRGVMVLLSDFLIPEGYEEGLRYLAGGGSAGGFDTYCLQILSPGEIDPALEGSGAGTGATPDRGSALIGDLRLTDVETGRAAEITVTADLLKQYRASVERYCDELRAFCRARGMNCELVRTDAQIDALLLDALRRRGMLG